jgi:hypothetical protein
MADARSSTVDAQSIHDSRTNFRGVASSARPSSVGSIKTSRCWSPVEKRKRATRRVGDNGIECAIDQANFAVVLFFAFRNLH